MMEFEIGRIKDAVELGGIVVSLCQVAGSAQADLLASRRLKAFYIHVENGSLVDAGDQAQESVELVSVGGNRGLALFQAI